MRKYRGLTKEGKWVYGSYTHVHDVDGNPSIIPIGKNIFVSVISETVEQSTGLKDKNSKEIYCGDKIRDCIDDDIGTVYWKESAAGFYVKWGDGSDMSLNYGVATCKCEIIDNTHPELMEQENGS